MLEAASMRHKNSKL